MRVHVKFWKYKELSFKEGEAMEEKGFEVEKEDYFSEAYIRLPRIEMFTVNTEGNITVFMFSGEQYVLKNEPDVLETLKSYFTYGSIWPGVN